MSGWTGLIMQLRISKRAVFQIYVVVGFSK